MTADFTISIDRSRNLLDVAMRGFYGPDDVARYRAAIDAASVTLGGDPADQVMVNDITGMQIQLQDIVTAFRGVMADSRYARRRVAFIVTLSLARMQVERVMKGRTARIFTDRAEAETWLFGPAERAVA
jgi:hypothetical protein